MFADLHLHTFFSDGTFSPEEVAALGKKFGLAALALTDHDSVEGCPRMAAACAAVGIEFITGTELTAEHDGNEVHILGYFVDTQNKKLLDEIAKFQAVRQTRIHKMVGAAEQTQRAAASRRRVRARQLSFAGPAACRTRARARGTLQVAGRSVRAVSQKKPACVGAQGEGFRARGH